MSVTTKIRSLFMERAGPYEAVIGELKDRLSVTDQRGPLISYDRANMSASFQEGNPVFQRLCQHRHAEVYLLSSLISVVNRAEKSYSDEHERAFHDRLLAISWPTSRKTELHRSTSTDS